MRTPTLAMSGKVTLITGGRRGLGKALALAFAEAGADVAICDYIDEDGELQAVADEIGKLGHRALAIGGFSGKVKGLRKHRTIS